MLGIKFSDVRYPFSVSFPDDVKSAEEWNIFWKKIINSGQDLSEVRLRSEQCLLLDRVKWLKDTKRKKVLMIGNGLSSLPFLFSYAGFDVKAIDISDVAVSFCLQNPPNEEFYLRFFGQAPSLYNYRRVGKLINPDIISQLRNKTNSWKEDTGSLLILTQSVFEIDIMSKYDCVFLFGLLDFMDDNDARIVLEKISNVLSDDGILILDGKLFSFLFSKRVDLIQLKDFISIFQESGFELKDKEQIIKEQINLITIWERWLQKDAFEAIRNHTPKSNSKIAKICF